MRVLVIGDTHIDDPYLDELKLVFDEILTHKADKVIHLGDYYNSNKPTPKCMEFGTKMATRLLEQYKDVTVLAGNGRHNWLEDYSVVGYLSYLGVKVMGMELEQELDGKKCFFGHYMTNESYKEYGSHEYTVADLQKYDIVLLGHQHIPQEITPKIHHVGSSIYQHFNEVKDPSKRLAVIENGVLSFIPLKSPIPMKDCTSAKEIDATDARTKVRFLIPDFQTFKNEVGNFKRWKEKFVEFKHDLRFEKTHTQAQTEKIQSKEKASSSEIIMSEVEEIKDNEVKLLVKQQFESLLKKK